MPRLLGLSLLLSLWFAIGACSGSAATSSGADEATPPASGPTDDPARARVFQGALDLFVRDLDRVLADTAGGDPVPAGEGGFVFDEPETLLAQGVDGGGRIEVGELAFVLRVVKDRGPPESERWEQTSLEATAVRAGGVFRFTRLHSSRTMLASAPGEMEEPAPALLAFQELREALVDGFSGPNCRFLPRLTAGDMRGLYDDEMIAAAEVDMAQQDRVDRLCADWWDRTPPWRSLEVTGLTFYRVDRDRKVRGTYETTLRTGDGTVSVGAVRFDQ